MNLRHGTTEMLLCCKEVEVRMNNVLFFTRLSIVSAIRACGRLTPAKRPGRKIIVSAYPMPTSASSVRPLLLVIRNEWIQE